MSAGLGAVGKAVFPGNGGDRLPALTVQLDGRTFAYGWRESEVEGQPDLVEYPPGKIDAPDPTFLRRIWTSASADPVWPWLRALDDLRGDLSQLIEARGLWVDPMQPEAAWLAATWLARKGSVLSTPVDGGLVREALSRLPPTDAIWVRKQIIPLAPLRVALNGVDELRCPYPDRDAPLTGWVWSGFSNQSLLTRTQQVYAKALEIYESIVTVWFGGLSRRLELAQLLPVRLIGQLDPGTNATFGPTLAYHLEPLQKGAANEIDISLGERPLPASDDFERMDAALKRMRPGVPWLRAGFHRSVLDVFEHDPGTKLAEKWLKDDLVRVKWLAR